MLWYDYPTAPGPSSSTTKEPMRAADPPPQKNLLLVEDEALLAFSTARRLAAHGYAVSTASSGEEAVAKACSTPPIDLVLMDINLGAGMDGTEAAQIILQERDIPVVFLSSHSEPEVVEKTEKITSYGYVVKGSDTTVLLASIQMAFKLHAAHLSNRAQQQALEAAYATLQQSEARVRASEERFRLLFENMTTGFALHEMIYDEQGRPVDYRYLEANPAFEALTGLRVAGLPGKTVRQILPNIEQDWIEIYGEVAQTGRPLSYTNYVAELKRTYDVRAFSPAKDQFAVIFSDITERQQAEDNLKELEQRYRRLFETIGDAILIHTAGGQILDCNPAACTLLGYSREELLALNGRSLLPEDFTRQNAAKLPDMLAGSATVIESVYHHKDGQWIPIEGIGKVIEFGGQPAFLVAARDIRARKQREVEMQRLVEEKNTLLSEIQHRIKNSLAQISSLVMLEQERAAHPETRTVLVELNSRVASLANLYGLLANSPDMRQIQLDQYLETIARGLVQSYLDAQVDLRLELVCDRVTVDVRRATAFGLILNELLTNAIKYAFPDGGAGCVWVGLSCGEGQVRLEVANDGRPLPADFDLGSTQGLGLQIVQVMAAQLRGTVTYRQDGRTAFVVTAPV